MTSSERTLLSQARNARDKWKKLAKERRAEITRLQAILNSHRQTILELEQTVEKQGNQLCLAQAKLKQHARTN